MLALASVTITLTLEGGATHTRTVRPALPTNDRQLWLKLLHLDLEAHPPQAAILGRRADAEPGSTSKVQLGLFSPQLPEPSRLDVTLARIRAIVGEENVGRAVLNDTHAARRLSHGAVSSSCPLTLDDRVPSADSCGPAMRRLRPPKHIYMTLQSEQPASFFFRDALHGRTRVWSMADERRLVESVAVGMRAMGSGGPRQRRRHALLLPVRDLLREHWQMVALYD